MIFSATYLLKMHPDIFQFFPIVIIQTVTCQKCSITILLDQLKDADLFPFTDLFRSNESDMIVIVDVLHESRNDLNKNSVLSLMHAISTRLRIVDIRDLPFEDEILRSILWLPFD